MVPSKLVVSHYPCNKILQNTKIAFHEELKLSDVTFLIMLMIDLVGLENANHHESCHINATEVKKLQYLE